MRKKKVRSIIRVLQIIAILAFIISCGSCASCLFVTSSGTTEYGREEEYAPGKVGARSSSSTEGEQKVLAVVTIVSGLVFAGVGFGSLVFKEIMESNRNS